MIIPSEITNIGDYSFVNCVSIEKLTIPNNIISIGKYAFSYCKKLASIDIPNGVATIGDLAFEGCENIKKVTIPSSVESIGISIFSRCSSLSTITVDPFNKVYDSRNDCNAVIASSTNQLIVGCMNTSIPNNVVSINDFAFTGCTGLKTINIPNKVGNIGRFAFQGCSNLTSINLNNVVTVNENAFESCGELETITIGSNVKVIGSKAFAKCEKIANVYCKPQKVSSNSNYGFYTCYNAFDDSYPEYINLYVPTSASEEYRAIEPWKLFKNIVEYDIPSYKLTYYVDGQPFNTLTLDEGTVIVQEEEPQKEGYTFSGWSEIPETMPANDVTITGTFSVKKYKLVYLVDGENYKYDEVEYGASVTTIAAPVKEGYTFSGWSETPTTMPAKDVTVTGTFTVNKYKLIYSVDGDEYMNYEIDYGASITPETEPTKEGYTFGGWSEIPETMPANDITITGKFTINKYKLVYMVDGVEYKSYDIEYGATITEEAEPTKEGHFFSGWSSIPATMPANDLTVSGTFTKGAYKLTYMLDGEVYKTVSYDYDSTITPEATPSKEGYTFSGWSEIPETMPANDVTVIGTFSVNKYKLTYQVDSETYKSEEVEYGASITPETAPTKEGYTFSGWSEIPETMPAHDVTVTGTFSINTYKLTYVVDGQTYKTYDVVYGTTITPEVEPIKEGYTFSGWSEIPETMPAQDVTATGTFSINTYKLTYMVDDEEYKTYELEYGASITSEAEPNKEGYTFSGWSEIPETMPAEDITVTGTFSVNKYKLTYQVDGEIIKSDEMEYGATVTPEAAPTKEGYTFSGWSEIPETMPAYDVMVTGTFSINKYKLTFMLDDKVYKEVTYTYGAVITPEPQPEGDYIKFEWKDLPQTMPANDVTVYADYTTGIIGVINGQQDARVYSPNGKRLSKPQKGVNIIRMSNGTTKKIVVKK